MGSTVTVMINIGSGSDEITRAGEGGRTPTVSSSDTFRPVTDSGNSADAQARQSDVSDEGARVYRVEGGDSKKKSEKAAKKDNKPR